MITYGPGRIATIRRYKIKNKDFPRKKFPFCYAYNYDLDKEIEKWIEENNIVEFQLYLDGDDCYSHDSVDTVNFGNQDDALAFKLRFS